jgi:uncharacterized protein (TIGR03067 family)
MFRTIASFAILTLSLTATARAKEPNDKKAPAELQGTWKLVALEIDGKPFDLNKSEPRWIIKDNKVQYGGEDLAVLTADATTTPRSIDLAFLAPKATYEAIYVVEKDNLKICLNARSAGVKERPQEFSTDGKENLRLLVFERDKGKVTDPTEGASGFIGVALRQNQDPKEVVINGLVAGGPAEKAGMKKDDLLVKVPNADATDLISIVTAMRRLKPGKEIVCYVKRDRKEIEITIKAGVLPFAALAQLE